MKNKGIAVLLFLLTGVISCKNEDQSVIPLTRQSLVEQTNQLTLSGLFGSDYKVTVLETTEQSLLGQINKIVKNGDDYYILCDERRIYHFDKDGRYISTFNRFGTGPEEYHVILDFDVKGEGDEAVIWICDGFNIRMYHSQTYKLTNEIRFPHVINKFRQMRNGNLLVMTGQNEKAILVCTTNGEIIHSFLEPEFPFLLFRMVQFYPLGSEYIYQLGLSNMLVSYNPEKNEVTYRSVTNKDNFMTPDDLLDLYEKRQMDMFSLIRDNNYVDCVVPYRDAVYTVVYYEGARYISKIRGDEVKTGKLSPNLSIRNDLFDLTDVGFTSTLSIAESQNSLIMLIETDKLEDYAGLKDHNGNPIQITIDDNPCLIEFF